MKLSEIFNQKKVTLSFEVFPPKTWEDLKDVKTATEKIASLKPDFMSVTYGAGGSCARETSAAIAENVLHNFNITPLAHLTCVSSTKQAVHEYLERLKSEGIENILALRGDIVQNAPSAQEYKYASELVSDIKKSGDFCVGGACYPEGHTESPNQKEDIRFLKEKVDCGCDFLTTQMFFDNNILYNFLYKIRDVGITVPVVAGIMPVTNCKQIKRICQLSGTNIPQRFKAIVDHFGDNPLAMKQAGIAYATDQIIDLLANGVRNIHVYTMNKPDVAMGIQKNLSEIL